MVHHRRLVVCLAAHVRDRLRSFFPETPFIVLPFAKRGPSLAGFKRSQAFSCVPRAAGMAVRVSSAPRTRAFGQRAFTDARPEDQPTDARTRTRVPFVRWLSVRSRWILCCSMLVNVCFRRTGQVKQFCRCVFD